MNRALTAVMLIFMTACAGVKTTNLPEAETQDQLVLATLWYQKSAEMKALCLQCYHNAETALVQNVAVAGRDKPFAVVLDIDETVLDNSPFQGWQVQKNKAFNDTDWNTWVQMASAEPLPGAVEFTRFADSLGVEVFYVSNRKITELDATLKNMTEAGFPYTDREHMLLKENTSSKVARREEITKTHEIVLLIGDNLADLDGVFEKRPDGSGIGDVNSRKDMFGTKYIILPNPMYGTWLSEILKKAEGETERQKLINMIEGF